MPTPVIPRRPDRPCGRAARALALGALALGAATAPAGAGDVQEYSTTAEALGRAYPDAGRIEEVRVPISPVVRAAVAERTGKPFADEHVVLHCAFEGESLVGRATVTEDIGKVRPMTYLVAADAGGNGGAIVHVELLVFRESHGHGVKSPRFMEQLDGLGADDRIRVGKDIDGVSGATLSARGIAAGTRRTLILLDELGKGAEPCAPIAAGGAGGATADAPA